MKSNIQTIKPGFRYFDFSSTSRQILAKPDAENCSVMSDGGSCTVHSWPDVHTVVGVKVYHYGSGFRIIVGNTLRVPKGMAQNIVVYINVKLCYSITSRINGPCKELDTTDSCCEYANVLVIFMAFVCLYAVKNDSMMVAWIMFSAAHVRIKCNRIRRKSSCTGTFWIG